MNRKQRQRHPAYAGFWVHPRHGCHEVAIGQDHRAFVGTLPDVSGHTLEDALASRWVGAVRWTGDKDFWLIRCQNAEWSGELVHVFARYLLARYPDDAETCLVVKPLDGHPVSSTVREFGESATGQNALKRPKLPGNPDVLLLSVRKNLGKDHCQQPHDRQHHPEIPGYWLHAEKGMFPLRPDEHHSAFFLAHPALFGEDLAAAFARGWVSIRRWTGYREEWAIRYDDLNAVGPMLQRWAAGLLERYPGEALIPVRCFPASDSHCLRGALVDVATGTARTVKAGSNILPPPEELHKHCSGAPPNVSIGFSWPDYIAPPDAAFKVMNPSDGDADDFRLDRLRARLTACEESRRAGHRRGFFGGLVYTSETQHLKSWIRQLEADDLPVCVGDGYREWFAHIRKRGQQPDPEKSP